jgi:hypothetical protein
MMGAPITASGDVIGVLHVGSLPRRQCTSYDIELLQLAADRDAMAGQSMMAQADRAAWTALQLSLVPSALPAVAVVEMAVACRAVACCAVTGMTCSPCRRGSCTSWWAT